MTSGLLVSTEMTTRPARASSSTTRDHPAQLLLHAHRCGAGTGGLAADINDGGAIVNHRLRMLHCLSETQVAATVGEGIGRDIEHAHHPGQCQIEQG